MSTHFSEVCFPKVRHFSGCMKRYDVMEEKSANGGADTVVLKCSTFFYLSSHYWLTLGSIFFYLSPDYPLTLGSSSENLTSSWVF